MSQSGERRERETGESDREREGETGESDRRERQVRGGQG